MSIVVVDELTELAQYIPAWEELAHVAIEPNVFYEPWMIMPALRSFGAGKKLQFVFVFAPDLARPAEAPILCGFFPLEHERRYKQLPISIVSLWQHKLCVLCTPLLRAEYARECLTAFFDWLASDAARCALMEFGLITADGPFHQFLIDYIHESATLTFVSERFTRALFRPAASADGYVRAALSRRRRKDLRREATQLGRLGHLEYVELEPDGDVRTWIEDFLQLEAGGWKGQAGGGALALTEADRAFFVTVATEAFQRGRLMMLALHLNGRAIAQKCNFLAGRGSFALKIAYDEDYGRFSPGVLLEIENIRRLHERPRIDWMDSCAIHNHFMINRLWLDRRTIETVLVATGKSPGDLVLSLMPLLRWLNRKLRRRGNFANERARAAKSLKEGR